MQRRILSRPKRALNNLKKVCSDAIAICAVVACIPLEVRLLLCLHVPPVTSSLVVSYVSVPEATKLFQAQQLADALAALRSRRTQGRGKFNMRKAVLYLRYYAEHLEDRVRPIIPPPQHPVLVCPSKLTCACVEGPRTLADSDGRAVPVPGCWCCRI